MRFLDKIRIKKIKLNLEGVVTDWHKYHDLTHKKDPDMLDILLNCKSCDKPLTFTYEESFMKIKFKIVPHNCKKI